MQLTLAAMAKDLADQSGVGTIARRIQQLGHRTVERARDLSQHENRRIANAGFEVREVTLGHACLDSECTARHPAARPLCAHPLSERCEKRIPGFVRLVGTQQRHRSIPLRKSAL
jgi:hypothetical protein